MDWYDDNEVLLDYGFEQRSQTREATTPWTGRVAEFANPDIAMLDRSAVTSGAIGGDAAAITYEGAAGAVSATDDPPDAAVGQTTKQTGAVAPDETTVAATDDTGTGDPAVLDTPQAATTAASSSTSTLTRVVQVVLVLGIIGLAALGGFYLYNRSAARRSRMTSSLSSARTATAPRPSTAAPSAVRRVAGPEPSSPRPRPPARPGSAASRASAARKR
jgi:hypothetical protein